MIEHPLIRRDVRRRGAVIENAVDVPVDAVGLPFDGEGVEVVGHRDAEVVRVAEGITARVSGTVNGAEDLVRHTAHEFHDVDLARLRPADVTDVGAQAPERGPGSGARRHLDARLDAPIGEFGLVLGNQSRGGELTRSVVARQRTVRLSRRDRKLAFAVGRGVLCIVGVVLELAVAPAGNSVRRAVADLVSPVARVGPSARRTVELVAPHQTPGIGTRVRCPVVVQLEPDRIATARSVEPEAQAVADAPVLATLDRTEQRRRGAAASQVVPRRW